MRRPGERDRHERVEREDPPHPLEQRGGVADLDLHAAGAQVVRPAGEDPARRDVDELREAQVEHHPAGIDRGRRQHPRQPGGAERVHAARQDEPVAVEEDPERRCAVRAVHERVDRRPRRPGPRPRVRRGRRTSR